MHGFETAPPHVPPAVHAREGEPLNPGTQVPTATVFESVLPGHTALLLLAAGHRLRVHGDDTDKDHSPVSRQSRFGEPEYADEHDPVAVDPAFVGTQPALP